MGRAADQSIATKQEFLKLEVLLAQTANDVNNCLKTLKENLGKHDRRHGRYFRSSSRYFMRSDIRVAKELATDLRYAAKRLSRNTHPTKSEINAARISTDATADAMNDLKQSGRIYDQNLNNGILGGATSIIDNILGSNDNNQLENEGGFFPSSDVKLTTQKGLFGHKHIGSEILRTSDTVEAVVSLTLRESFDGFSALKQQITATENAMSLSFVDLANEADVDVASKLTAAFSLSPSRNDTRVPEHVKAVSK